jgi:hypothetical protein
MVQGEAIADNARVDRVASRGDVTVSEAVWRRLGPDRQGGPTDGAYRVSSIPPTSSAPLVVELDEAHSHVVLATLPSVVQTCSLASGLAPAAEFRPVSTFFVSLPHLDVRDPAALARLQDAVVALRHELTRLGTPQLEVLGDKGLGFIGVFGLPPQAYDDDAVRAIEAALMVRSVFAARGMKAPSAWRRAWCGQAQPVRAAAIVTTSSAP